MSVPFTPGAFEPVIQASLQPGQPPHPVFVQFDGFVSHSEDTYVTAHNASSGRGANSDFKFDQTRQASKVVAHLLAARNLAEQFQTVEKKTPKVASALCRPIAEVPEPIARAYNYYGHFDIDGKLYASFDLERKLTYHLVRLAYYATDGLANLADEYEPPTANLNNVDYSRFGFNAAGEMCAKNYVPLDAHLRSLCSKVLSCNSTTIPFEEQLALVRMITQCSSEYSLPSVESQLRQRGVPVTGRRYSNETSNDHTSALKSVFNVSEFPTKEGDVLKTSVMLSKITIAYRILNLLTDAHRIAIKCLRLPKYEGGSKAQLACVNQETGHVSSPVPLSLSELTFAGACLPHRGPSRMFVGNIFDDPIIIRMSIIRASLIAR